MKRPCHLLLFPLSIICLFGALSGNRAVEFTDDFFVNRYHANLVNTNTDQNHQINLRFTDRIKTSDDLIHTFEQLQKVLKSMQPMYASALEISGFSDLFPHEPHFTLIDLLFPLDDRNENIKEKLDNEQMQPTKFNLELLNLTSNGLTEDFLLGYALSNDELGQHTKINSSLFQIILLEYFSHVKFIKLSFNKLRYLRRVHFSLFRNLNSNESHLETLLLDSNEIKSIQHDTFYDLTGLKYLDLSRNKLKLIHPLTFQPDNLPNLFYVTVSSNELLAVFNYQIKAKFTVNSTANNSSLDKISEGLPMLSTRSSIKYFFLNENEHLKCDCGLLWLHALKGSVEFGQQFKCLHKVDDTSRSSSEIVGQIEVLTDFDKLTRAQLKVNCPSIPELVTNDEKFAEISAIPFFKRISKAWFRRNLLKDDLPVTTPAPYLMSDTVKIADAVEDNSNQEEAVDIVFEPKKLFLSWILNDAKFECSVKDTTKTAILWKTQYGYLSNIDTDLMKSLASYHNYYEDNKRGNNNTASYKIFYKMTYLTKIHKNFTVKVSRWLASGTESLFYVNEQNNLVVTNLRHVVAGPFSCMAIDEKGMRVHEYEIQMRSGIGEHFILSLFVSLISMIVPSILGLIVCCYCEWEADKNYPMTPPCYPTPLVSTPPNFDFNEWLANAGSYLPNINIHDTLEQVSKKLRKGMEKASVTVKSLGITSQAYIYSMYEQSSQRLSDMKMKSFVPTLNMPNVSMPTMRYPPMGQLANRMKSGVGNMFVQLREFCGTSDLNHTASMVDLESDTNTINAVGKTYMMDQIGGMTIVDPMNPQHVNYTYYQKFLQMIRDEHNKRSKSKKTPLNSPIKINEENEDEYDDNESEENSDIENQRRESRISFATRAIYSDDNPPTTSAYATTSSGSSSKSSSSNAIGSDKNKESGNENETTLPKIVLNSVESNEDEGRTKRQDSMDDKDKYEPTEIKLETTAI